MRALTCTFLFSLLVAFHSSQVCSDSQSHDRVTIRKENSEWQLIRNGQPFYIKGAVGGRSSGMLSEYGGNAVRIRARRSDLDRAHEHGLAAMVNLPVRGERNDMDWGDEEKVAEQTRRVINTVNDLKDQPAVLLWAIGNELDYIPPGKPHHPKLWDRLNDLAKEIKQIDPDHPVLTVVGSGRFETKIQQVAEHCPDIDLLGINTYGDIAKVTRLAREYWPKPYVIAEWGPTGHWQVPKTEWGAPIEQTSTEKARVIFDRYEQIIQADRAHCLGSFVFYWAEKQETTHTWYGLFRDGMKTESIDAMKYHWSGSWPENRAPAVIDAVIDGFLDKNGIYLRPNHSYSARAFCYDCEYDSLTFTWDIRPEVVIPEGSYAGGMEKPALPIPGLIETGQGARIEFKTPSEEGAYRLFVQITDGENNAGYANVPFYVGDRAH